MGAAEPARPTATATIEPVGRSSTNRRDYFIKLAIQWSPLDAKYADKAYVTSVARKALDEFPPLPTEMDRRAFGDLAVKTVKGPIGVEGSAFWHERPDEERVQRLRTALDSEGYRAVVREVRECNHPECLTEVMVEWSQPGEVPRSWYSSAICGKHDYRMCTTCKSTYLMTSTSAFSAAPSLRCEVCGEMMVEWGGSKIWNAELVSKGA